MAYGHREDNISRVYDDRMAEQAASNKDAEAAYRGMTQGVALTLIPSLLEVWVQDAQQIIRPILEGSEITDRYFEVEKEAMRSILEQVEQLASHFKTLPAACDCLGDECCPGWQAGYGHGFRLGAARMAKMLEAGE